MGGVVLPGTEKVREKKMWQQKILAAVERCGEPLY